MWVKAKETVYLPAEFGGFRQKGEEFDYSGPENENLEAVDKQPYYGFSTGELKQEIARRGLVTPPPQFGVDDHKSLNDILVADDNTKEATPIEPKPVESPEPAGSGTDVYGASDWTEAGEDAEGFPVAADSPKNVRGKKSK